MISFLSTPIPKLFCESTGKALVTELGRLTPTIPLSSVDWPFEIKREHVMVKAFFGGCFPKLFEDNLIRPVNDWLFERQADFEDSTWSNANKTGGLVLDGALKWHTDTGRMMDIGYDMLVLVSGPRGTGTQYSHSAYFKDKYEMKPRFCAETNTLYYVTGDTIHRSPIACPEAFRVVWRWTANRSIGGTLAPIDVGFDISKLPSGFLAGPTRKGREKY